jgi:hypothetical protein
MADGTVRATAFELPDWEDIVAVSASPTAALGLDADGRVRGRFFRQRDEIDLSGLDRVAALAAGGTHHAFVFADGTVAVAGDVSHGEGQVSGWVLAVG